MKNAEPNELPKSHEDVWGEFSENLAAVYKALGERGIADVDGGLHQALKGMHWDPIYAIQRLLESQQANQSSYNVGSMTGLFFEQAASAIVVPATARRVPGLRVERNRCSALKVQAIARDPDLHLSANGRHVVVEIKASPKKNDLEKL